MRTTDELPTIWVQRSIGREAYYEEREMLFGDAAESFREWVVDTEERYAAVWLGSEVMVPAPVMAEVMRQAPADAVLVRMGEDFMTRGYWMLFRSREFPKRDLEHETPSVKVVWNTLTLEVERIAWPKRND